MGSLLSLKTKAQWGGVTPLPEDEGAMGWGHSSLEREGAVLEELFWVMDPLY